MRGCELLKASLRVPGVECVAVSDLWEGRLTAAQEMLKKPVAKRPAKKAAKKKH